MKNKAIITFWLLIFLSISKTFSQGISYSYDENGNRTDRHIIVLTQNKSLIPPDSTNNSNDTTLAQNKTINASFSGNKILIYPNPAKYYITVDIENISEQQTEINICDVFGKAIEQIPITENHTLIDFSQKATGTYLLKLTINNKSEIWKIIKE
jgi:hypothetical protein